MSELASIGFRLHTGWAMLVVIAADGAPFRVLHRRRMELLPPGLGRFVYHDAANLPLPEAGRLIESVRHAAEDTALEVLRSTIKNLKVISACIPTGAASVPEDLASVLRSHTRIHAAEGALYSGAIASACKHLGIPLIEVRERDIYSRASKSMGMSEAEVKGGVSEVRKFLGPPWTIDHKIAMAAALVRA